MWIPGPVSFDWVTGIVALAGSEPSVSEFWVVDEFRLFEKDLGRIFLNWRLIAIDEMRVNLHSLDYFCLYSHSCLLHRALINC